MRVRGMGLDVSLIRLSQFWRLLDHQQILSIARFRSLRKVEGAVMTVALSITRTLLCAMACWSSMRVWMPALTGM
jgi:hypothetical protein